MKSKIYLFLLVLLAAVKVWGQNTIHIDTLEVIPPSPTVMDTVKIRVQVTSMSYGQKIYDNLSFTGDTIHIGYCLRMTLAPAGKTYTDTFSLGILPSNNYTIKAKAYHTPDSTCTQKYDSTMAIQNFIVSPTNSVENTVLDKGYTIQLFPNPAKYQQQLILETDLPKNFEIELYNSAGQLIKNVFKGQIPPGQQTLTIEASDLPKGIYFYEIFADKERHSLKTIIK